MGSFVLQASAFDNDTDVRSRNITYSIDSDDDEDAIGSQAEHIFRIDPTSGVLELAAPLPDDESDFRFDIVATDDGAPPLRARAEAVVLIQHSGQPSALLLS